MGGFKAHLRSLFQYSAQHLCKAYTDSHKLGEFLSNPESIICEVDISGIYLTLDRL